MTAEPDCLTLQGITVGLLTFRPACKMASNAGLLLMISSFLCTVTAIVLTAITATSSVKLEVSPESMQDLVLEAAGSLAYKDMPVLIGVVVAAWLIAFFLFLQLSSIFLSRSLITSRMIFDADQPLHF